MNASQRGAARRLLVYAAIGALVGGAATWLAGRARQPSLDRSPPDAKKPAPAADPTGPWFAEVAVASGVDFKHSAGTTRHRLPEIMGGGAAFLDYDGDGDLDLYLVQSGELDSGLRTAGNRLYRNAGDATFEDVTVKAGVGDLGYGMGCAAGDYDGDGDLDLFVSNVGQNVLYRNDGDGTFTDIARQAGIDGTGWSTSAAFFDFDADGDLDLYVAQYIHWSEARELTCLTGGRRDYCSPNAYRAPAPDLLYRNLGGDRFEEVGAKVGLDRAFGNGLGVTIGDFNGDGWLDVYVANDGTPNQLWLNRGGLRFDDGALLAGAAVNAQGVAGAGMGVVAFDLENDGDLDLFVTHMRNEMNTLYVFEDGAFQDASTRSGLALPSLAFTGFGTGFADFDLDGHIDLYVANGGVKLEGQGFDPEDPFAQPDQLFRGVGGGQFVEVLPRGGTATPTFRTSRAAAFGDYDDDGDVDVVVVDRNAPVRLLRNLADGRHHWIGFDVRGRDGHDATGAMVGVSAGGQLQWRPVGRSYSYLASNDPCVHFGLGDATKVDAVRVRWSADREESFGSLPIDRLHRLEAGTGEAGTR